MFSRLVAMLDNLSEFAKPSMEGRKIRFVVNRRLVHVIEDLLCNKSGSGEYKSSQPSWHP
jgi:hypothetical protein